MHEIDFAVVTPLPEEWHAVRAHLDDAKEVPSTTPTVTGRIGKYRVVLQRPMRVGGYSAADTVRQTAEQWKPRWVALVGVAGGFVEAGVAVGDVVVASRIYAYEYGKIHEAKDHHGSYFKRRDTFDILPDPSWQTHVGNIIGSPHSERSAWVKKIKARRPDGTPKRRSTLHLGPVASGEKVVDDPTYEFFSEAKAQLPDLFAVEMEGAGAGAAIEHLRTERQISLLMIRGISDAPRSQTASDGTSEPAPGEQVAPRGTAERDSWKAYAADAAAAFLEYLLSLPGAPPSLDEQERQAAIEAQNELRRTLSDMTHETSTTLRGELPITPRPKVQAAIDNFFSSSERWGLLVGESGVGKSVEMAQAALRLADSGWSVLLLRGRTLDLEASARNISGRLPNSRASDDWYQLLINPWKRHPFLSTQGFALLIDGIDEQDRLLTERELLKLHDALNGVPPDQIKVFLSCGEVAWEELKWGLPFGNLGEDEGTATSTATIKVGDFDSAELSSALTAIGATEYLISSIRHGLTDPHVVAVRELLSHPGTFAIYAELRRTNEVQANLSLTWVGLLERYIDATLRRVSLRCRVPIQTLKQYLVRFASLAHQSGSQDFRLDVTLLRDHLPELSMDDTDPTRSPWASLESRGIFETWEDSETKRFVSYRRRNVGVYFLSLFFEAELTQRSHDSSLLLVSEWLEQVYEFPPVVDAVVALAHRLAPGSSEHTALVSALVTNPSMRLEVVFRIMPPSSVKAILDAISEADDETFEKYREAILAIPPSPSALAAFRSGLRSSNSRVLRLAIRAAGVHKDAEAVPALGELLSHRDEDIQSLAVNALGRIGKPAVQNLVQIAENPRRSEPVRLKAFLTLRAIGLRDPAVSDVLESCLSGTDADSDLRRNALLVAAALRTPGMTTFASRALRSTSARMVQAAAKLLTEVPDPTADTTLLEVLDYWSSQEVSDFDRFMVVPQLNAALLQSPTDEKIQAILRLLRHSFESGHPFSKTEASWVAERLHVPEAKALIFSDLIKCLEEDPPTRHIFQHLRILGECWRAEDLEALKVASRPPSCSGSSFSNTVVNALIESTKTADESVLRDGTTRRSAIEVLVRCQADDLVVALARLLPFTEWPLDLEICDVFWILGDYRAEDALLSKLNEGKTNEKAWHKRSREAVLYALSTSGTIRSRVSLVDALVTAERHDIQIGFPHRVLVPLARRGILGVEDLVSIINNDGASEDGRLACLIALAELDAASHTQIFLDQLDEELGIAMRAYTIGALGWCNDPSVVPMLVEEIQATDEPFIAEHAALALARLHQTEAVPEIEAAFTRFANTWNAGPIAHSLALLNDPRSLPLLRAAVHDEHLSSPAANDIITAIGEFWPNEDAREVIINSLHNVSGGWSDRGTQLPAISVLAQKDPNFLLEYALQEYNLGGLEPSTKQDLAYRLPTLFRSAGADSNALMRLLEKLLTDPDSWVREQANQAMVRLPRDICEDMYLKLLRADDPLTIAYAVRTLGFWRADEEEIEKHRLSELRQIREAADASLLMRDKRIQLDRFISDLGSEDMHVRAVSFFVLSDQGDEATVYELYERYGDDSRCSVYIDGIAGTINRRRRDEHRKMPKIEERALDELGTIRFD